MSIRLSPALRRALVAAAVKHERSLGEEAHYLLCAVLGVEYRTPRVGTAAATPGARARRALAAARARWGKE